MQETGSIEKLAKEAQREYHRKWRKANPDKIKKNKANYWRRKAERMLQQQEEQQ